MESILTENPLMCLLNLAAFYNEKINIENNNVSKHFFLQIIQYLVDKYQELNR